MTIVGIAATSTVDSGHRSLDRYSGVEGSTVFKEYIMTLKVTETLQKDEVKFKKASPWNYSFEIALDDDYASVSNGESI